MTKESHNGLSCEPHRTIDVNKFKREGVEIVSVDKIDSESVLITERWDLKHPDCPIVVMPNGYWEAKLDPKN
jgi:hypothetical protein